MQKVRMGVIGAGWWATQFHLPSLKNYEKSHVAGIAEVKSDKLGRAAEYYDIENAYQDHRELLASGVDGVVIAVQHAYHYQVARDALDAGVHVLVEKPMTLKASEAWDLVDRADRNNLHLMVGYTYQFTRHAEAAREIVQSGRIGDLQFVSGIFTSMFCRLFWLAPLIVIRLPLDLRRLSGMGIFLRPDRYWPVSDSGVLMISSYGPSATMCPPCSPAPGPRSTMWSAARMMASSCSTMITVLPMSRRFFSVSISL